MTWLAGLIGLPMIASPIVYVIVKQHRVHLPITIRVQRIALIILLMMWLSLGAIVVEMRTEQSLTMTVGTIRLHIDGIGFFMSILILLLTTCIVIFSEREFADEQNEAKYYALVLIMTGSMVGLVCATDLFNLWVWFEVVAISSYLLVAFHSAHQDTLRGGVKYYVQTTSGSVLALFAIGLIFAYTGTLDITAIDNTETSPLLVVAGALFIIGFGVKASLAPNYTWLPDAYAEAPAPISALLSGVVTVTALITLIRTLTVAGWSPEQWGTVLMVIGTVNIVIGNLAAVVQTRVKRILAYSSITHIGFIVFAFGIGISTHSDSGMQTGMLHLFVHGLMKALVFLALGALAYGWHHENSGRHITVLDLRGALYDYPGMVMGLTLAILSLAGVPPLAGFYTKLRILSVGITSESTGILGLTIFVALNTIFALGYYLPIISALYRTNEPTTREPPQPIPLSMRLPVYVLSALIVIFGIAPGLLESLSHDAGVALLDLFGT